MLERLRLADGKPLAIQQAYVPEHVVPGLVDHAEPIESLYRLLADAYGVRGDRYKVRLRLSRGRLTASPQTD